MARHLSFWIGFFAAALVIVPVAVGAWGVTQGFARDWAATFFIVICTLVGLLVLALLFRGVILRRLTGRAEATVEDISSTLISGVSAAVAQDRAAAEQAADKLARVVLGWYAWSNFYRWVIGTALALLLAFASFTGTVLLFEQIAKLEDQTRVMQAQQELMDAQTRFMESQTERLQEQTEQAQMQNEIMTLSLVSELRTQILNTVEDRPFVELLRQMGEAELGAPLFFADRGACSVGFDPEYRVKTPASPSTRLAIRELTRSGMLAQRVIQALEFLVRDEDSGVALSALLILDASGHDVKAPDVVLSGVFLSGGSGGAIALTGAHQFELEDSVFSYVVCPDCKVLAYGSMILFSQGVTGGYDNVQLLGGEEVPVSGGLTVGSVADPLPEGATEISLSGVLAEEESRAYLPRDYPRPCERLRTLAQEADALAFRQ